MHMKILTVLICLICFNFSAQIKLESKESIKAQSHEKASKGKYYSEYVVKPEKLKTFFHSNTIPDSFPKYDKYKSFEENKEIAKEWARKNKALIKEEYWYKIDK